MNKIVKPVILISEGKQLSDKLELFRYFLRAVLDKIKGNKIKPILNRPVTLKNKDGIFYCGNHINSAWVASIIHEKKVSRHITLSKGIFIDVGANIGKYTIKVARQLGSNGEVIAVEPEPSNFKILIKNIELNKLNNVSPFNLACSSKKGTAQFYLHSAGTGSHSLFKKTKQSIKVKLDKLDNLVPASKINKIALVKIDVEGAELDVLKGAIKILKNHPKIIIELEDSSNLSKVQKFLKPFGYTEFKKLANEEYLIH